MRTAGLAFAIVVVLCVLGVILLRSHRQKSRHKRHQEVRKKSGKQCPSCKLYVHPAASVCKHCMRPL